jgi:hypothetical protein
VGAFRERRRLLEVPKGEQVTMSLVVVGAVLVTGWLFVAYLLMNPEGM